MVGETFPILLPDLTFPHHHITPLPDLPKPSGVCKDLLLPPPEPFWPVLLFSLCRSVHHGVRAAPLPSSPSLYSLSCIPCY